MKVTLIRHFKVGFRWKMFYNSRTYEVDCGGYNTAAVVKSALEVKPGDRIISSTMSRALETSKIIFQRDPDLSEDALCEVPIKPFMKTKLPLPKRVWDIVGRLQWRFNSKRQPESFTQTKERVYKFLDKILEEKTDVIIVCHGWIIKVMIARLKALGFKGPNPVFIKNGEPYVFTKA